MHRKRSLSANEQELTINKALNLTDIASLTLCLNQTIYILQCSDSFIKSAYLPLRLIMFPIRYYLFLNTSSAVYCNTNKSESYSWRKINLMQKYTSYTDKNGKMILMSSLLADNWTSSDPPRRITWYAIRYILATHV